MTHIMYIAIIAILLLCQHDISYAYTASTSIPPLLDVPVYSLSTLGTSSDNDDNDSTTTSNKSTMNILTYATPVSVKPYRMWSISLYKGTLSHENFKRNHKGILQLLCPEHASCKGKSGVEGELIRLLGGSSGNDVDKRILCKEMGYEWEQLPKEDDGDDIEWPLVLPSCIYYLKLELVGDMIDCGSHEVALCKVVSMISSEDITDAASEELDSLSTKKLRMDSIISELGRVIQLDND